MNTYFVEPFPHAMWHFFDVTSPTNFYRIESSMKMVQLIVGMWVFRNTYMKPLDVHQNNVEKLSKCTSVWGVSTIETS
jgi:hypothetical protein